MPLPVVALIDVLHRAWDGVDDLACRGYLDPDWENWQDIPLDVVIELASLAARCANVPDRPVRSRRALDQPQAVAIPGGTRAVAADLDVRLRPPLQGGARPSRYPCEFYEPCGDGLPGPLCAGATQPDLGECPHDSCPDIAYGGNYLLGERAGVITTTSRGKIKHSDRCPACGEQFADVIARRDDPQQQLFDTLRPTPASPPSACRPHPESGPYPGYRCPATASMPARTSRSNRCSDPSCTRAKPIRPHLALPSGSRRQQASVLRGPGRGHPAGGIPLSEDRPRHIGDVPRKAGRAERREIAARFGPPASVTSRRDRRRGSRRPPKTGMRRRMPPAQPAGANPGKGV